MAKRPRVPAALHAELTEYSSLLRALRTSNTLDLAAHLTQPPPLSIFQANFADDVSLTDDGAEKDEEESASGPPPSEFASQDALSQAASSSHRRGDALKPQQSTQKRKPKQRDTWTRWPLLSGDVHVPEWGLSDEVKHIAELVLTASRSEGHGAVGENSIGEKGPIAPASSDPLTEEEDRTVPDLMLHALTADSAVFLTRVLALSAAHVPAAGKSMQNRITPINWESVVDVACAHGVVSPRSAEVVRECMSRIYPPSRPNTFHRTQHLRDMKQRLSEALSKHENGLLDVPNRAPTGADKPKPAKRKRAPSKKNNEPAETEAGPSHKRRRSGDG